MSRWTLTAAAMAALFVLGGCLESKVVILVQKDGSGTVEQTGFPAQKQEKKDDKSMITREQVDKMAANMGEGVTVKSFEELTAPDGRTGFKIVYAFSDLNKLQMGILPSDKKDGDEQRVKYEFTKGVRPKIVVTMPPLGDSEKPAAPPKKKTPEERERAMKMMQAFGKGMKVQLMLKVDGTIKQTNSSFVNKKRDGAWLIFYDMDGLLKDPVALKRYSEIEDIGLSDAEKMKTSVKDKEVGKYIMVELEPKIEIEFE